MTITQRRRATAIKAAHTLSKKLSHLPKEARETLGEAIHAAVINNKQALKKATLELARMALEHELKALAKETSQ